MHRLNPDDRHDETEPVLIVREVVHNRFIRNKSADDDDGKFYRLPSGHLPQQSIQGVRRRDRFELPGEIITLEANLPPSSSGHYRTEGYRKSLPLRVKTR